MKNTSRDIRRTRPGRFASGAVKGILAVVAWLAIWQVASLALANPWLLSSPVDTLGVWANLILTGRFWTVVVHSLMRIALGFVVAFAAGCALGYLAARLPGMRTFLKPAVLAVKSAPVVCIIALLLVAAGSSATTSIVVGLVVFPQFYHAVMEAALSRDTDIDEVLAVFGVSRVRRALCVELVAFGASIRSATAVAAGLAWKSGVAAEIIGLPGLSIGESVYLAKISLDSATIIAWTGTVILLSWLSERLLLALVDAGMGMPKRWLAAHVHRATEASCEPQGPSEGMPPACGLVVEGLARDHGTDAAGPLLRYADLHVPAGARLCVMAPSGAGKTTLLRIIAGIERPDTGTVVHDGTHNPPMSVVLQDRTLVPWASTLENIALVANDESELRHGMRMGRAILDEEDLAKPARALSGGMGRRAELCRALAHPSSIVILDEPFSGLDAHTKARCIDLVNRELGGRTLIIASHDEDDAAALGCDIVRL